MPAKSPPRRSTGARRFTTRDPGIRQNLLRRRPGRAGSPRLVRSSASRELGSRTSLFGPLWYAGSFALGAAAGLLGTATGLGFVVETERQVEEHLSGHLDRLPAADLPSRAIVRQMRTDEVAHGAMAARTGRRGPAGARARRACELAARVMTTVAHRL